MALASVPVTRFRVTELRLGWLKRTDSLAPTENLLQSIAALSLLWLMVVAVLPAEPVCVMVALPAVTWPPAGAAKAGALKMHSAAANAAGVSLKSMRWGGGHLHDNSTRFSGFLSDFALPFGTFGNRLVASSSVVPDDAIDVVHAELSRKISCK